MACSVIIRDSSCSKWELIQRPTLDNMKEVRDFERLRPK